MKSNGRQLPVLLIPIIIMIIAAIVSAVIHTAKTQQYSTWQPTEGIFLEAKKLRMGHNYKYTFSYTVGGQSYTGSNTYGRSSKETRPNTGDVITVWYDPQNPSSSSYHKPNADLDSAVPFFFAIPLSIAILIGTHNRRKDDGLNRNYTYREI